MTTPNYYPCTKYDTSSTSSFICVSAICTLVLCIVFEPPSNYTHFKSKSSMPSNNDDESCTAVYLPSHLREELKEWLDKQHNYRLVTPNSIDDQRPHARRSESPKSARRSSKAGSTSRQHQHERNPSETNPQSGKKPPWQRPGRHSTRSPDTAGVRPSSISSRRSTNDIHERLYRQGLDSVTKREEEARAARVARRKKEDLELRRSKALEKLSLVCVGAKDMTPQKRAEELAKFEREAPPRIDKDTEAIMVVRLGQRRTSSQGSARSHGARREETFHPKTIDSRLKNLSSGELDEHFQALYQDSHKRTRRTEELGARLAHQRKTRLVEERLASDIIFRRQVKSNPSLKDKYFDICE